MGHWGTLQIRLPDVGEKAPVAYRLGQSERWRTAPVRLGRNRQFAVLRDALLTAVSARERLSESLHVTFQVGSQPSSNWKLRNVRCPAPGRPGCWHIVGRDKPRRTIPY